MILGTKENNIQDLRGYENDPLYPYVESFINVVRAPQYLNEGYNYFGNIRDYMMNPVTRDEVKRFFVENSYDPMDPRYCQEGKNANSKALRNIAEHTEYMEQLFENDLSAPDTNGNICGILGSSRSMNEASPLINFNNVVGMTLPVHKNILMNAVFDQVLPKKVSRSNRFTESIETREMIDTDGKRIDMFYEQNKMTPAINKSIPQARVFIPLPEMRTINILQSVFGLTGRKYHLSVKSSVIGIIAESWTEPGDSYFDPSDQTFKTVPTSGGSAGMRLVLFKCNPIHFDPYYGDYDATINCPIKFKIYKADYTNEDNAVIVDGALSGARYRDDMFHFSFMTPTTYIPSGESDPTPVTVAGLLFYAAADASSAAFPTVQFDWRVKTKQYQIPDQPHITVTVTPESVKDIQASYDVNQITKLMSMMQLGLLHWKDDNILKDLDNSFLTMPDSNKVSAAIDWAPPLQFNGTPRQWRRDMYMEQLNRYVTRMLQVLNDDNMTILVFGSPNVIENVIPEDFSYTSPSSIGPVQLDFTKTVCSSGRRTYNFVSSQKLRNDNNFIVLLVPRNTMRITYELIDYQLYVSNELRDTEHYEAPAMTCFERWFFLQFQPVQGRIMNLNIMGTREQLENPDPVAQRAMYDDTSNYATYASNVNGVVKNGTMLPDGTAGEFIGQAAVANTPARENRVLPTSLDGI